MLSNVSDQEIRDMIMELAKRWHPKAHSKSMFFSDVNLDGFDAYTFMSEFAEKFDVEMSAFIPDEYFTSEENIANIPKTIWRGIFNRKKLPHKEFDLNHLCQVVRKKEWFDPAARK